MAKIVRTPTRVAGGITAEEKLRLDAHSRLWIERALRTAPIDPQKIGPAIRRLYAAAKLKAPRVVIVPSPIVMAFAGGFASAIWYARAVATRAATDAATIAATHAATRAATLDATVDAADAATLDAALAATDAATLDATLDATRAATYDATRAATYDATYDATLAATDAATNAATRAATLDATRAATYAATRAATDAATDAATRAATDAATRAATRAATDRDIQWAVELARELGAEHGVDPTFMLSCVQRWWDNYQGGNMWAGYDCYISAFRDVLGLRLPEHEAYAAWEQCQIEGGFRWVHAEFAMVCDFPEVLKLDDRNRPHCADGPSHRWRDGWSLYHWHGVRVPDFVVERPASITIQDIDDETNAEVRRVMIERYGYERYLRDGDFELRDHCGSDHQLVGLRDCKLWARDDLVLLDMLNSTPEPDGSVKRYVLPVDPDAYEGRAQRECLAAMASTWRKRSDRTQLYFATPEDYRPLAES